MHFLRKSFFYLFCFTFARGSLFVTPIFISNLLTSTDYGILEFAYAIASVSGVILALGTNSLVPLVIIRKISDIDWKHLLLHQSLIFLLLFLFGAFAFIFNFQSVIFISLFVISIVTFQAFWSATLKSLGRVELALFIEASFWLVAALAVSLSFLIASPLTERGNFVTAGLIGYATFITSFTLFKLYQNRKKEVTGTYFSTLSKGIPLMLASLMAILATTSGRLGLGMIASPSMLADYAILFRATALPILFHQVIVVARYRQIFELPTEILQKRLPIVIGLVFASVVLFWLLRDFIALLLGQAFISVLTRYPSEGLLILSQCILWSAIALNDLVNARAQIAGHVVRATAVYFLLTLPIAWWFLSLQPVTLTLFVPTHSLIMGGYFLTQTIMMWHRGIKLKMTWISALTGFILMSIIASTNNY